MALLRASGRLRAGRMRRRAFTEFVVPPEAMDGIDRDAWAERLRPLFGHDLADHPPVVLKQLAAMNRYDASPRLHLLAGLPTLVVGAAHDRIARLAGVRALAAGIAGSRLVVFDMASHGVTIQRAEAINALLEEHFHSTPAASRRLNPDPKPLP